MAPHAGIAMPIGIAAAVPSADTFPSVSMGLSDSYGSQATIMDGYPTAQTGEIARARRAAFSTSMVGGPIGAPALAARLRFARPIERALGTLVLFMLPFWGSA